MSGTVTEQPAARLFRELGEQIRALMERLHVPGVAVGLLYQNQEYAAGFGSTSVENPLPVDADTLFQIGSTTKTVTGTAVMRLVEQGRLDLDRPLREYLPDLRLASEEVAARATLRHVLTHTGGWVGDYFVDTGPGADALARVVASMAQLPQQTPLGTTWSYNNAGFYLAGRVIEIATGQPYEAAIKELVLEPLGMRRSFFFAAEVISERFAVGHGVNAGQPCVLRPWGLARSAHPAGGLISSARDQLRYARFQLGDGGTPDGARLLRPATLALMQQPHAPAGSMADAVGITWLLRDVDGVRLVQHGGATFGQLSTFVLVPEQQFALTVLTNADTGAELNRELVRWALRRYLGVDDRDPAAQELPEDVLQPYAGRYSAALTELQLRLEHGALLLQVVPKGGFPTPDSPPWPAPPPVRLAFFAADRVVALDPPFERLRGEFLRDAAGTIVWFRFLGRLHRRELEG